MSSVATVDVIGFDTYQMSFSLPNAGVLQNFNAVTFEPVGTVGGFAEIYYYMHPKFHLHCGYGIDDPVNSDLAAGQISSNQTLFTTAIWDISKNFQFGMEVDYQQDQLRLALVGR